VIRKYNEMKNIGNVNLMLTDGIDKNHVSTGYWWHRDKAFSIDNKEMRNFTPEYFIPIYSDIT